ncbi:MAG: hypothetical protein JWP75_3980 [Frondihabitans sp.]|nr:hypothetical protein [Frondihabitans sp.]
MTSDVDHSAIAIAYGCRRTLRNASESRAQSAHDQVFLWYVEFDIQTVTPSRLTVSRPGK